METPPPSTPSIAVTLSPIHQALLVAFLESIPDRIYFKNLEGRFIAVSRSKYLRHGFKDASEIVGKTDFDMFPLKHAQRALADEQAILRTGEPMIGVLEYVVWPDGAETWTEVTKMPLRDASGATIGTWGISKDVTAIKNIEQKLEEANRNLIDTSRIAGMAEVAAEVLHNVGNVLNSANVSVTLLADQMRTSKLANLSKVGLMLEHEGDLASFLSNDPKGKLIPSYLITLAQQVAEERERMTEELSRLRQSIEHIKEIVSMQEAYATMGAVAESLQPSALFEEAIRMNAGELLRQEIAVERDFGSVPNVIGERGKILQILVDLIRNAKLACTETETPKKRIRFSVRATADNMVQLIVDDNGVGISAENINRIFQFEFTTRTKGHAFGLHSSANAAKQMKGRLIAESEGLGRGARFILEVPVAEATFSDPGVEK